jgi:beta-lactam-binding protein with PASTA domain
VECDNLVLHAGALGSIAPLTNQRLTRSVLRNALLGLGLLATAGMSAVLTMRSVLTAQDVVVPNLVGRNLTESFGLAAEQRLSVKVEGRRHDPQVAAERVAAQEPPGTSLLKTGRTVRVWVSLGPLRIIVPAVEGTSLRSARLTLEQAHVTIGRVVEVEDPAEEGTILVQHPAAGEAGSAVDGVSLLVSRGPRNADYLMPDLIGRPAHSVLDRLRAAGLKVAEVRYRTYPGVAPGIVLRQIPAAGHRVSTRGSVSLDISKAES